MTAIGIMKVRPNVPFDILVPNLTKITLHVPKHMLLCSSSDSMVNIIDPAQVDKERCRTVATVQVTSKPPVQMKRRANTQNKNEDWRDTIDISPEFATYRTQFINILEEFQERWDGHLRQINTATNRVELPSPEAR